MSLELFPLDSQICHITLASYGWTDDDVKYIWKVGLNFELVKKNIYIFFQKPDPVQIPPNIFLPGGFNLSRLAGTKVGAGQ